MSDFDGRGALEAFRARERSQHDLMMRLWSLQPGITDEERRRLRGGLPGHGRGVPVVNKDERLALATRAVVLTSKLGAARTERTQAALSGDTNRVRAAAEAAEAAREPLHRLFDELRKLGVFEDVRERISLDIGQQTSLAEWVGISESSMERVLAAALADAGIYASDALLQTLARPEQNRLLLLQDPEGVAPDA
jgi:hypothetical protein